MSSRAVVLSALVGLCAFACGAGEATDRAVGDRGVVVQVPNPPEVAIEGDRKALVIGNAAYHEAKLRNPVNDALAMRMALQVVGFDVPDAAMVTNATRVEIRDAVETFADSLEEGDVALVYYAGHGIEVDGKNYLLGVEFVGDSEEHVVDDDAIELSRIINMVGERAAVTIMVLDACRNDPFTRGWSRSTKGRGFAAVDKAELPGGLFLAYSTSPGDVASDGDGNNSPFTEALVRNIASGEEIDLMFRDVRESVMTASSGGQRPWVNHTLTGRFYFVDEPKDGDSSSPADHPLAGLAPVLGVDACADAIDPSSCLREKCDLGDMMACTDLGDAYTIGDGAVIDPALARDLYQKACDGGELGGCVELGGILLSDGLDDEAIALYETACEGGAGDGCYELALLRFDTGNLAGAELEKARTLLVKACEGQSGDGCGRLAEMYRRGEGVVVNLEHAAKLHKIACDARTYSSCATYGQMLITGDGPDADPRAGTKLLVETCAAGGGTACVALRRHAPEAATLEVLDDGCRAGAAGSPLACIELGQTLDEQAFRALREGTVSHADADSDWQRALELHEDACAAGEEAGCEHAGWMILRGRGLVADRGRAFAIFESSCRSGHQGSCVGEGYINRRGLGRDRDYERAHTLFDTACSADHPNGCEYLADIYYKGRGVTRDYTRAFELRRKACDLGSMMGCNGLGWQLREGLGTSQDTAEARRLFDKACTTHPPNGCVNLAAVYTGGIGVALDPGKASELLMTACYTGDPDGCLRMAGGLSSKSGGISAGSERLLQIACDDRVQKACDELTRAGIEPLNLGGSMSGGSLP